MREGEPGLRAELRDGRWRLALGVITGEVGTGKTAAVRAAVAGLDPAGHAVIYIGNPAAGVRGYL